MRARGRDSAQRWASILVGAAVVFLAAWMTYEAQDAKPVKGSVEGGTDASADVASATAAVAPEAGSQDDLDGGLALAVSSLFGDAATMPSGAPRHVKIGVVLVTYSGAEGAPPNARNKRDAQTLAERLGQDARSDFHRAVTGGDTGSSDDIGRIPRGVLDPRTEVAVFALSPGEISDVLETPKGYWIVKRIE